MKRQSDVANLHRGKPAPHRTQWRDARSHSVFALIGCCKPETKTLRSHSSTAALPLHARRSHCATSARLAARVRITGRALQLEPMNSMSGVSSTTRLKMIPTLRLGVHRLARIKQITLIKRQPKRGQPRSERRFLMPNFCSALCERRNSSSSACSARRSQTAATVPDCVVLRLFRFPRAPLAARRNFSRIGFGFSSTGVGNDLPSTGANLNPWPQSPAAIINPRRSDRVRSKIPS